MQEQLLHVLLHEILTVKYRCFLHEIWFRSGLFSLHFPKWESFTPSSAGNEITGLFWMQETPIYAVQSHSVWMSVGNPRSCRAV